MSRIRVFITDDHAVLRAGLKLMIDNQPDMEVVGEANSIAETLQEAPAKRVDVLTLDLSLGDAIALNGVRRVRDALPQTRILVLTMHDDVAYVHSALAAGAGGYVVKQAADVELLTAIRAVSEGRTFVNASAFLPARANDASPGTRLSEREQLVLRQIAQGMTNQQIADQMDVSVKTVESYRARLMKKLSLKSRAEIYRYALGAGWLADDKAQTAMKRATDRPGPAGV